MSTIKYCLDCGWAVHEAAFGDEDPDLNELMIDHAVATGHTVVTLEEEPPSNSP